MPELNANIILAGQGVNALGAIAAGNEAAAFQRDALHQRDYRNMLAQNGADILAGKQPALNALAGYDPSAALGIQGQRQDMQFAQQRMDVLTEQEKRAAAEYARGLSADQAAAEAAQLEGAVKQALMLPDAASWDAFMTQHGMTDLVGQFGNRQALAGKYMSMAEVLKQAFPAAPTPLSGAGKLASDLAKGLISQEQYDAEQAKGSKPLVQVDMGQNSSEFAKESDKAAAGRLGDIVAAGNSAPAFLADMNTLAELAKGMTTGKEAEVTAALGPWAEALGVKVDGLGAIQTYDSIVARLAPQMRVPGAGASSDFDARQFLKSLPSLGNTPDGNALIIQTFQDIANMKIEAAAIARKAQRGEISWQEAEGQIAKLADPFAAFKAATGSAEHRAPEIIDGYQIEEVR